MYDDSPSAGAIISGIIGVAVVIGLIVWFFAGIDSTPTPPKPVNELQSAAETQKDLVAAVPVPQLTSSSERANVAKRAELFQTEGKITYIYLISYGKVMAFYPVSGKVSSLRSYMTPVERLVKGGGEPCNNYTTTCYVIESADIDGTYGENVDGIFFFTTEGAYVEWRGEHMVSDQPLKLATPPALIRTIE